MNWTKRRHAGSRGSVCALAFFCIFLNIQPSFGAVATRSIMVDDGVVNLPSDPGAVTTVSMPELATGSSLVPAGQFTSNLGTFDIVIQAGPTLAANAPALAAFNRAANLWESYISDPITVVVEADLAPLGVGILGSTSSELLAGSFNTIRNAMVADAANELLDDAIVAALPTAANYTVTVPAGFGLTGNVFATKANLKALGFTGLDAISGTPVDVHITFSSTFSFDFDKSDGISAGQFDFEGTAAHEIGHGLGFLSGVDDVDFILPNTANILPAPLDMFRFRDNVASDPATAVDFSNATFAFPRNMVPQHQAMFDQIIGGFGGSVEVLLSQGRDFGDGNQASHWKDSLSPIAGIMDPTVAPGEMLSLTLNDLRAMDLIGYEITVPEPGSLGLLLAGCALLLWARRP